MNRLPGTISAVQAQGSIAIVDVAANGHVFTATLLGDGAGAWITGTAVTLLFKETEVSLAKNLSGLISMRNRIPCTIIAIERGALLTRVMLDFDGHVLESVITTRSSHALSLTIGDVVEGLVKANEMTLAIERRA